MIWQYTASIINGHSTFSILPHFNLVSTISVIIKLVFSLWVFWNILGEAILQNYFNPLILTILDSVLPLLTKRKRTKLFLLHSEDRKWNLNMLCCIWRRGLLIELIEERQIEIWPGPTPNLLKKIREFFFVLLQKFLSFILPGDDWWNILPRLYTSRSWIM